MKDFEIFGGCKVKSVGYLNINGVIVDVEWLERGIVLDRGYIIVISNVVDDFFDVNYGLLEFGFVFMLVMLKFWD